jgi:predicted RNA binding protein YcfA (HicA-like mRNA interferase family)
LSAAQVRRILEAHGFEEVRRRGSHISMRRQVGGESRTVVVPDHREIAIGTLVGIIRQSGLSRDLFEE